ncbi:MAG TPA: UDP-N-acetylmuramoyl-L-alanyl-D-glutamate--2,6-diaminopimelate ligase [Bacillota bacterium]
MKLRELLKDLPLLNVQGNLDLEINSVVQDSREAKPGSLFIAVKGAEIDGHNYIMDAVSRGALAVMVNEEAEARASIELSETMGLPDGTVCLVTVADTRKLLFSIGNTFYQKPASHLKLIGVVGTNGKTTSTFLIKSILETAGKNTGLLGTICNILGKKVRSAKNTTPGTLELQELFAQMVQEKLEYVVMEVSSHAIAQERIGGLDFAGGVFTNITQDHLDYHHTFSEYFQVKSSFFQKLSKEAFAVINLDDPHSAEIIKNTVASVLTYGLSTSAQVRAEQIKRSMKHTEFNLVIPNGRLKLRLNLIGDFNIYNALAAAGCALALGIDPEAIKRGLESVSYIPGRFQTIPESKDFTVVIDYAHTPDGLENLLRTARSLTKKRLITVFGCGGDRDRGKRPIMGRISARYSDFSIITNDNPRSEDPAAIAAEIEEGFIDSQQVKKYKIVLDRKNAIEEAIFMAEPGDLVVIAGKGHENYQVLAGETVYFDDREVASAALKERYNG